ncbi:exported hypothetical protein [Candidatus Sulfobium mesophilum]|uniref:Uncharacterized protein n=1 Tax=Candidatus Sulfobium mesophilum TaxID=2016548 RepID=A0A2U3QEZ1_9BACT|nr:exported hypothetical protein [Candidatus Sulfobium mesophilum]
MNLNSVVIRYHPPLCLIAAKLSAFMVFVSFIAALGGCSVAPSETTVAKAITDYFESSHYKVVDLKIGKIEGMPLSEKKYMGTPGYVVDIVSITIEAQEDKSVDIRRGNQVTFSNANVRLRQDMANKNTWQVSIISGITVP